MQASRGLFNDTAMVLETTSWIVVSVNDEPFQTFYEYNIYDPTGTYFKLVICNCNISSDQFTHKNVNDERNHGLL